MDRRVIDPLAVIDRLDEVHRARVTRALSNYLDSVGIEPELRPLVLERMVAAVLKEQEEEARLIIDGDPRVAAPVGILNVNAKQGDTGFSNLSGGCLG